MALQKRYVSSASAVKTKRSRKPKKSKRLLVYLGLPVLFFFLLLLVVRPYRRMEQLTKHLISSHAPAGTKIGDVDISFPSSVTLTDLEVPLRINKRERSLRMEKLSGTLSFVPLLNGMVDAELNSDFFGGILWVKIRTKALGAGEEEASRVGLEARARGMDLSQLSGFLESPISATGKLDVDVEGDFDRERPVSFTGKALAIGKGVGIPQVEMESLTLPPNRANEAVSKISMEKEIITIDNLTLNGTAYDLSGSGTIVLKEPAEESQLNCNLGVLFKERFAITDRRLSGDTAESIVDALINSKSKVFFKINGTVAAPEANIDPASSLGPFLKYLNK